MDNNNIFFINLKKDSGRYENIRPHIKKLNGQIWEGVDPTEIDINGYATKFSDKILGTIAAKIAKLKLFEFFLKNNKNEYLILFEDDIMFHKKFYDYIEEINDFLLKQKPKLLYFGVSSNIESKSEKLIFNKIFNKDETKSIKNPLLNFFEKKSDNENLTKPHSGAYGVCINRNIIQFLILRMKNPILKEKPFDMSCLGQIQRVYTNDCYITDPPLVIPYIKSSNIRENRNQNQLTNLIKINMNNYFQPLEFPLFVEIIDKDSFIYFDKIIKCLIPIFRIYYIVLLETYKNIKDIFLNHDLIILDNPITTNLEKYIRINNFINKNKIIKIDTKFTFKYKDSNLIYQTFGRLINSDTCDDSRITIIKI
jgi:GR25 family glycosyltransferase involved in LPS biosynthesis